jgi:hypothetical protein
MFSEHFLSCHGVKVRHYRTFFYLLLLLCSSCYGCRMSCEDMSMDDCSGRGICWGGSCVCSDGWRGERCEVLEETSYSFSDGVKNELWDGTYMHITISPVLPGRRTYEQPREAHVCEPDCVHD